MSLTIKQAKEILGDQTHSDAELQAVLDTCDELVDIFLIELTNKDYDSRRQS